MKLQLVPEPDLNECLNCEREYDRNYFGTEDFCGDDCAENYKKLDEDPDDE